MSNKRNAEQAGFDSYHDNELLRCDDTFTIDDPSLLQDVSFAEFIEQATPGQAQDAVFPSAEVTAESSRAAVEAAGETRDATAQQTAQPSPMKKSRKKKVEGTKESRVARLDRQKKSAESDEALVDDFRNPYEPEVYDLEGEDPANLKPAKYTMSKPKKDKTGKCGTEDSKLVDLRPYYHEWQRCRKVNAQIIWYNKNKDRPKDNQANKPYSRATAACDRCIHTRSKCNRYSYIRGQRAAVIRKFETLEKSLGEKDAEIALLQERYRRLQEGYNKWQAWAVYVCETRNAHPPPEDLCPKRKFTDLLENFRQQYNRLISPSTNGAPPRSSHVPNRISRNTGYRSNNGGNNVARIPSNGSEGPNQENRELGPTQTAPSYPQHNAAQPARFQHTSSQSDYSHTGSPHQDSFHACNAAGYSSFKPVACNPYDGQVDMTTMSHELPTNPSNPYNTPVLNVEQVAAIESRRRECAASQYYQGPQSNQPDYYALPEDDNIQGDPQTEPNSGDSGGDPQIGYVYPGGQQLFSVPYNVYDE
ncbi:hypothetical protein BDV23DRAFT_189563 [Aspergillus alliaceus]|uniref:Uncharacterized protein n=1 Tax=Petromyces alliaceus TaxID=209559 RepID=A0A5N7BRD5_PETAA|nr:hypothetical protein BDV23DRAFT_189563 [Aspergillus alliaceus]